MSSKTSRQAILARVQKALKRDAGSPDTLTVQSPDQVKVAATFERLSRAVGAANPVGLDGSETQAQRTDAFIARAQQANTPVEWLDSAASIVGALKGCLVSQTPLYVQQLDEFTQLDWQAEGIQITADYSQVEQWGLVRAECAIAETGSVVLVSGAHHAVAAGFLPDNLVVLLRQSQIVTGLEDIWPLIDAKREQQGLQRSPRAVNIVTGPSRTADVEQVVQLGAHGPRSLKVLLLAE